MSEVEILQRKVLREQNARREAESLLETKSLQLYEAGQDLQNLNETLELRVEERTSELLHSNQQLQEEIKERLQAEALLKQATGAVSKLSNVISRAQLAVLIADTAGIIEWANDAFCQLSGFELYETVGQDFFKMLSGFEPKPALDIDLKKVAQSREGAYFEISKCNRQGTRYWSTIEILPLYTDGQFTNIVAFEASISARKLSELRLKLQADVLELIAKSRPLPEVLQQLCEMIEAIKTGAAVMILLRKDDDNVEVYRSGFHGNKTGSAAPPSSLPLSKTKLFRECFDQEALVSNSDFEAEHLTPEERLVEIEAASHFWSVPIKRGNQVIGILVVFSQGRSLSDLETETLLQIAANLGGIAIERDRQDEELREAHQAAEMANHAKSDFLANMSHEIRTPITAIAGFADLLAIPGKRDPLDVKWARHIVRSSGHLCRLLDDVLDLSKVEAGRLGIEIASVDLPSLVRDVAGVYGSKAKEKLLGFEVHFAEGAECRLISDETRLRQILINLVSNAVKYTQKGKVQIKISVDSETAGDDRYLRMAVRDTGIGIAEEKKKHLFQPFNQVHDRRFQAQGTGLGLAFSYRLTELIGGKLEVKSSLGGGSCFTLSIPYRAVESSPPDARTSSQKDVLSDLAQDYNSIQFNGLRLLIAEDTLDNQEIFLHMLKPHGLEIDIANNGREAVDKLEAAIAAQTPYDLVIMDMQMPIMDGYEATREIRLRGYAVPIIALTAYAMEEDKQRCLDVGCSEFQSKPILRRDLVNTIYRISRGNCLTRTGAPAATVALTSEAGSAVDIDGFRQLVERYLQSLKGYLSVLEVAGETEDLSDLRIAVHRIRGTAANYGFDQISQEAGKCDQILRKNGSLSAVRQPLERLKEELRRVLL